MLQLFFGASFSKINTMTKMFFKGAHDHRSDDKSDDDDLPIKSNYD